MPWLPNGDYYIFSEDWITKRAPTAPGVYGLYNIRHQILIGESANIRDTLLRHKRETHFHLARFQPTGFTFEHRSSETREARAAELIAEYQPVLNNSSIVPLGSLWRSWTYQGASAFHPPVASPPKRATQKLLPAPQAIIEKAPTAPVTFWPSGRLLAASAVAGVVLAIGGYFGTIATTRMTEEQPRTSQPTLARQTVEAQSPILSEVRNTQAQQITPSPPAAAPVAAADQTIALKATKNESAQQQAVAPAPAPKSVKTSSNKQSPRAAVKKAAPVRPVPPRYEGKIPWTVQVRASANRGEANNLLGRLKARGYDAFLTESDIKGQTWYRVRVGNFANQQQAELMQKKLRSKEGLRDAFVANNGEAVVLAAQGK